ncbi:MAG: hypothetical protein KZQ99_02395 [Candidatus Thiodiazotropha sp. (ex Dulcina madagascariensis)]|nr:hypothetical protein [Candidatus Thiodiazotropha sp. (ex Dulcina madagascariensis)]
MNVLNELKALSATQAAELYCTDEYPRDGCHVDVAVHASGFSVAIFPPKEIFSTEHPIEVYGASDLDELQQLINDWLSFKVGKRRFSDQESCVTS